MGAPGSCTHCLRGRRRFQCNPAACAGRQQAAQAFRRRRFEKSTRCPRPLTPSPRSAGGSTHTLQSMNAEYLTQVICSAQLPQTKEYSLTHRSVGPTPKA